MSDRAFVGREDELRRLSAYLDAASAGHGQVCFVAGEPGAGKTALVREFAVQAQSQHSDLLVAVGDCNAQTGSGEAFLPFREVLALLTGDLDAKLAQGAITLEAANRVRHVVVSAAWALVDTAPDLIGLFIPGATIVTKVGTSIAKHVGLEAKLSALMKREQQVVGLPQPAISRENIFEQYSRFLLELAARQPLMIVLDDLQWIDSSSADLLFHLARRIEQSRILIVGTYRPADVAGGRQSGTGTEPHPLDRIFAEIKRYYGDVVVDLDGAEPAASRRFVHELVDAEPNRLLSDFREALFEHTGGNPLFVVELLRDLRERGLLQQDAQGEWGADASLDWSNLPARVEGVIEGRVARLDGDLRETLTVASAEGEEFVAEVVAQIMNLSDREAVRRFSEELAKKQRLVNPAGTLRLPAARVSRYRFHQRLLRLYLYDRLDEAQRAYLHEDVAKGLESLYRDNTDDIAVQLAWHYSEAGMDQQAAAYYRRAGELAAASHANDEAAAHLTRSLTLTPESDARTRYEVLLIRESVYERQGKRHEQSADLAMLAELAAALKDVRGQAEVSLRRANYARLTGDYPEATTHAQAAVELAGQAGDKRIEAQGYAMVGLVLRHQGNFGEASEWLDLALGQAQSLGEDATTAQITYFVGLNQYSSDKLELARASVLRARETFERLDDRMGQANCLLLLGTIASREGDNGEAIRTLQQALDLCRRVGWRSREAFVLSDLSSVQMESGDYPAARSSLSQALLISREVTDREGEAVSLDNLGVIEQQLGRHAEAIGLFQQALAIDREIGYRRGEGYVLTHLGYSYLESSDLSVARRALDEAVALRYQLADRIPTLVDTLAGLARVALESGDKVRARAYATEALDQMRECNAEGVEYPIRDYLVCFQVLRTCGEGELAARALEEGYALLRKRAASLTDASLRQSYLTNVPFNRELSAAYEGRTMPA